jgi:hypothetical protein
MLTIVNLARRVFALSASLREKIVKRICRKQRNLIFHKEDCYGRNGPAMTGNAALIVVTDA